MKAPTKAAAKPSRTPAKAPSARIDPVRADETAEAKETLPEKRAAAEDQFAKADAAIKVERELDVRPEDVAAMRAAGLTF